MKKIQQDQADRLSSSPQQTGTTGGSSSSFLDDWLAKRQQIAAAPKLNSSQNTAIESPLPPVVASTVDPPTPVPASVDELHIRDTTASDDGVSIKLR